VAIDFAWELGVNRGAFGLNAAAPFSNRPLFEPERLGRKAAAAALKLVVPKLPNPPNPPPLWFRE
jgi:hypothetical protein